MFDNFEKYVKMIVAAILATSDKSTDATLERYEEILKFFNLSTIEKQELTNAIKKIKGM